MRSLSYKMPLGGAVNRRALAEGCRESAVLLARELGSRQLVYQEVSLEADTEEGMVSAVDRFARTQVPANLHLHLERLAFRLHIPAPVENLTVRVTGLAPALAAQITLFDARDPLRAERLERVCAAVNHKHVLTSIRASGVERREKMFSFYDPWRWGGALGERTAGQK